MIVVIDNYDSFVYTLAGYVHRLGHEVTVVRNDAIDIQAVQDLNPIGIILSPGPCTPNESGICLDIVRKYHKKMPIFGVCLGHQVIGQVFGAKVVQSPNPMHGKTSTITHTATGILHRISTPTVVARYHSLIVTAVPTDILDITATTTQGTVMAIHHKQYPCYGVQFHPESVLTQHGMAMVQNFLDICTQHKNITVKIGV